MEFFRKHHSDLRICQLRLVLGRLSLDLLRPFKGLAGESGLKLRFAGSGAGLGSGKVAVYLGFAHLFSAAEIVSDVFLRRKQ